MNIRELRQLSKTELEGTLNNLREKLRDLRFKATRRELKDVRDVRSTRRIIARILTLLRK